MKKIYFIAVLSLLVIISGYSLTAKDTKKAENFRLKDYNGKEIQLSDFKSSKAVVLIFVSTQCPVSNAYNSRMAGLFSDYKDKGIAFLGINSNEKESVSEIKDHAKNNDLGFSILKDEKNIIADKFSASVTPEVFVLNGNNEILYHGRIDDSRKESDVKSDDLRVALDQILAGKQVANSKTKAFGCSIKRAGE
ncbi:MAG: thioredoxin family protein [Melioribacteraceae bacterium]